MSEEGEKPLSLKRQRFAQEYLVDGNGTQAAIRAGYSPRTANEQAARLLANVSVKRAIIDGMRSVTKRCEVDADWIRSKLKLNAERALQEIPVLDKEGEPTGEYRYEGNVANRALELLGKDKAVGMFEDAVKGELIIMTLDQKRAELDRLAKLAIEQAKLALPSGEGDHE